MDAEFVNLELVLRVGVFGCFWGHGWIAFRGLEREKWVPYLNAAGFTRGQALILMPLIGLLDLVIATITLLFPFKILTAWAVVWAFSTAAIRPLAGESLWAFVERAGNWATPLALLWVQTHAFAPSQTWVLKELSFLSQHLSPSELTWELSLFGMGLILLVEILLILFLRMVNVSRMKQA
eukprot:Rmarinus@m.24096